GSIGRRNGRSSGEVIESHVTQSNVGWTADGDGMILRADDIGWGHPNGLIAFRVRHQGYLCVSRCRKRAGHGIDRLAGIPIKSYNHQVAAAWKLERVTRHRVDQAVLIAAPNEHARRSAAARGVLERDGRRDTASRGGKRERRIEI